MAAQSYSETLLVQFQTTTISKYQNKEGHMNFFGFPAHVKVMFTLYCKLLSVPLCLKKTTYIPYFRIFYC